MPRMDPSSRSRTGLFLSYRDSSFRSHIHDHERDGLIHHHPIHIALPPQWVDLSDQVSQILAETQAKIAALEKLHAKHVLPGFADRSLEERDIEALTSHITRDFRRCQALILRVPAHPHAFPPSPQNDPLAAKNAQRGLAAKVQDLSASFRKKQRVYLEKLQGHAIKNQDLLIASGTISLKGPDGLSAVDDDVQAASQSQSFLHSDPTLDLHTRDRELSEIAKSIASLAELFKDLSALVIDQGTLLDSVEYNIEQTAAHVSDAVNELNVATQYQRNTGRRKCIFLLLLIIFGLVLVLIFKPRRHAAAPLPPASSPSPTTVAYAVDPPLQYPRTLRFRRTYY